MTPTSVPSVEQLWWEKYRQNLPVEKEFLGKARILVLGAGSIGKRHLGNLVLFDVKHLAVVEPRADRQKEVREKFVDVAVYSTAAEAYQKEKFDGVVVATPTAMHVTDTRQALEHGADVLLEKAISNISANVPEIIRLAAEKKKILFVGYTYRFWPPLKKVEEILRSGRLGQVYASRIIFSEYLPDWHPWEDYRTWYMARKDLGGGELSDESHAIDFARWLFGEITEVGGWNGQISRLEMTTDDFATLIARHESGMISSIHLDCFGRWRKKEMEIFAEKGTLIWKFPMPPESPDNSIEIFWGDEKRQERFDFTNERNEMFIYEMAHFLDCMEHHRQPIVDGADALRTLRVVEAVVESTNTKRFKSLDG